MTFKKVTSVTSYRTEIGDILALTYSEINESGAIIKRNAKLQKVVIDEDVKEHIQALRDFAQNIVDETEGV